MKGKNCDLLADFRLLKGLEEILSQLLNAYNIRNVSQREVHTDELLVPRPVIFGFGIAIVKFKKYKSPGSDQIPTDLYEAGGESLVSVIHKLITSI
jgi:hypothetical protein